MCVLSLFVCCVSLSVCVCCVSLSVCVSLVVLLCVLCATLARLYCCACAVYSLRRASVAHCEGVLLCGHCSAWVLDVNEGTVSSG